MIELERHIEILLLSNDCVIVPGFGGFTAHHVEARYADAEQLFLPPLRTLGFNPQLTMNDSLLALSYVEAYDISYPEALRRIENDVCEMKQRLNEEGHYELNYIGTICLNEEGHYEFEPSEAGILTPDLYGLSSFEFPILTSSLSIVSPKAVTEETKDIETTSESTEIERPITVSAQVVELRSQTKKTSTSESQATDNETEKTVSIRISVLRDLAIAVCVVLAFLLFPTRLSNDANQIMQTSKIDTGLLYRIMPKDITTGQVPIRLTKPESQTLQTEMAARKTQKLTEESVETERENPYYSIILASRVTRKNARIYVDQLHRDGYKEAAVLYRNKGAKVIFGQFETENEAYTVLKKLHRHSEFAEAWVMFIK